MAKDPRLCWNQIKMLQPSWLSFLPALTSLNLLGTHLECITGRQLQGPQNLSHLLLGSSKTREIYPPWPPVLLSLEVRAATSMFRQLLPVFRIPCGEHFLFLENLTLQITYMLLYPDNTTVISLPCIFSSEAATPTSSLAINTGESSRGFLSWST